MNVFMWFCLFHASTVDPGYLPRNIPEYDMAIKQVDYNQVFIFTHVHIEISSLKQCMHIMLGAFEL